ncbi:MAG: hypothetical protein LBP81_01035 [Treponema sp.]|jgi:hypothetical protein|nr:hypothetical protein [Treponema sp.]
MKKFFAVLAAAALAALPGFTDEFNLSGEVKTGLYWEKVQDGDGEVSSNNAKLHNTDDAGNNEGRLRLNFHYRHDTIGMKLRIQESDWGSQTLKWGETFPYAFIYGNFLDDRIKLSAGGLGDSPWGIGGPEEWDELDTGVIGIRTEIKSAFIPGLNIGFVLNDWNAIEPEGEERTLGDLLQESVLGASYDHEYFGLRFACRLDSKADFYTSDADGINGAELIYRLEERSLKNLLPGFQIWANGHYKGINKEDNTLFRTANVLYIQYAPELFTAQIRLGCDTGWKRQELNVRGSFCYNILNFLSAGASASYIQDYETKISPGSPFSEWNVEPMVKVTLGGAYIEFVYHYGREYTSPDVETKTHWINLRLVYTF